MSKCHHVTAGKTLKKVVLGWGALVYGLFVSKGKSASCWSPFDLYPCVVTREETSRVATMWGCRLDRRTAQRTTRSLARQLVSYTHAHTHMYIRTHTCTQTHTHTIDTCARARAYTHTHIFVDVCKCVTHTHTYTQPPPTQTHTQKKGIFFYILEPGMALKPLISSKCSSVQGITEFFGTCTLFIQQITCA